MAYNSLQSIGKIKYCGCDHPLGTLIQKTTSRGLHKEYDDEIKNHSTTLDNRNRNVKYNITI